MQNPTLYYVHDPMCSWCYGFCRSLQVLQAELPEQISWRRLVGGLAPDNKQVMDKQTQLYIQQAWRNIMQRIPGVSFNFEFWEKCLPQRSTYPACRAVLAAQQQGLAAELDMLAAIQEAYYQRAENPSLDEVLIQCAQRATLDIERFIADYSSLMIEELLQQQIQETRRLGIDSFPSLGLQVEQRLIAIQIDYVQPERMIRQIQTHL